MGPTAGPGSPIPKTGRQGANGSRVVGVERSSRDLCGGGTDAGQGFIREQSGSNQGTNPSGTGRHGPVQESGRGIQGLRCHGESQGSTGPTGSRRPFEGPLNGLEPSSWSGFSPPFPIGRNKPQTPNFRVHPIGSGALRPPAIPQAGSPLFPRPRCRAPA